MVCVRFPRSTWLRHRRAAGTPWAEKDQAYPCARMHTSIQSLLRCQLRAVGSYEAKLIMKTMSSDRPRPHRSSAMDRTPLRI